MRERTIVAVHGPARSGKDTFCMFLKGALKSGVVIIPLAQRLKEIVAFTFGFSHHQMYGELKEQPDARYATTALAQSVVDQCIAQNKSDPACGDMPEVLMEFKAKYPKENPADHFLSPRRALQLVGTEGFRAAHCSVWVRQTLQQWRGPTPGTGQDPTPADPILLVPDIRFLDELHNLRRYGRDAKILAVKVHREVDKLAGAAGAHRSESGIADEHFSVHIDNSGTLADLSDKATALAATIHLMYG